MTTPITGITSVTPELASLLTVLTTIVRRKMGTTDDGTTASQVEMKGTTYLTTGTLKRSNNMTQIGMVTPIESNTNLVLLQLNSQGPCVQVGEETVMGVTTSGYDGYHTVTPCQLRGTSVYSQ